MKCSLGITNFVEEISSFSHSIVFLYFFAFFTEEGFLTSLCSSLNSTFRLVYFSFSLLPFTSLLFSAICEASLDSKASVYNAGDLGSISGSGRSPGEGNGNPLQYYCLENPMDRGAWWATVHWVAESGTTE